MTNIRRGIPHLKKQLTPKGNVAPHISDEGVLHLIKPGYIFLDKITEKTDGQTFVMGIDQDGFYTRSSGTSDIRVRDPLEYVNRAIERNNNMRVANGFAIFHDELMENKDLQDFWKMVFFTLGEQYVRGEVFNNFVGVTHPDDPGQVKYVNTYYKASHFGTVGAFVLHTGLEENAWFNTLEFLPALGTKMILFDHDIVEHDLEPIDVRRFVDDYHMLAIDMDYARDKIHHKIAENLASIKPKWGLETEGYVVHPTERHSEAPRFKIISERFTQEKQNGWQHQDR